MDLVYINAYIKLYQNSSFCSEELRKNTFLHKSRAITLLFIYEFSLFAIPNHSSLISMSMQSLKKIGQKLHKLRVRKRSTDRWKDGQTDGRMDTQTVRRVLYNTPPLVGYKNDKSGSG